jgi:hypothetical protein
MRKAYLVIAIALAVAVVAQFYFAAFGVFGSTGSDDDGMFTGHRLVGTVVIPALSFVAFIVALLAKAGGRTVGLSILPLGLVVVQILLFILADALTGSTPERVTYGGAVVLGLHAVNGLAILLVSVVLVFRARKLVRVGPPARATKAPRPVDAPA